MQNCYIVLQKIDIMMPNNTIKLDTVSSERLIHGVTGLKRTICAYYLSHGGVNYRWSRIYDSGCSI